MIVAAYCRVELNSGAVTGNLSANQVMILGVSREGYTVLFLVLTGCRCAISTALLVKPVRKKVQSTLGSLCTSCKNRNGE
jgi:hypothetical protein